MKTEMKQGGVKFFSRMNPQSRSLHRENGQFVDLLKHNLMTDVHKLR